MEVTDKTRADVKGKKYALKKYDQFALNTGCFWGKYQIKYVYP